MYMMKEVASFVFFTMIFPHNGKVIMVNQLTYYETHPTMNLNNILLLLGAQLKVSPFLEMGLWISQYPSLLSTYQGDVMVTHHAYHP
jgi:hypothetical protein